MISNIFFAIGLLFSLKALVPIAFAQAPCYLVGGCAATNPITILGPYLVNIAVYVAAGLSVLFVIWGGLQMLMSMGDETKINTGRMSILYSLGGFIFVLLSQAVLAFTAKVAYDIRDTSAGSGTLILSAMTVAGNVMYYFFNFVFVLMMIFAGFKLLMGQGKAEGLENARNIILWAIAGALIVNLARAIVNAVFALGF